MKKFIILLILSLFAFLSYGQLRVTKGIILGPKNSTTVVKIDSISYVGGELKFYNGATNMLPASSGTAEVDSSEYATQYDLVTAINEALADSVTVNEALEAQDYLLPPKLTQTQINALTPVDFMLVCNTTTGKINYYFDGAWREIATE